MSGNVSDELRAFLDAPPDPAAPTPHEQHLADLAMDAIGSARAQRILPTALVFHPDDLTDRMDTEGVTLWGLEIRHSADVERGTVEVRHALSGVVQR